MSTDAIRTAALVGHASSGKTTLAEALLHQSGAIPTSGSVERGTTVCDYDLLEKLQRPKRATGCLCQSLLSLMDA
jgi:elongation factor G